MLNTNEPNGIGAVNGLKILAFTAAPMATAKRVGISIHLLNRVVSPKLTNIKMTNNAKPIGEIVYTYLEKIKYFY